MHPVSDQIILSVSIANPCTRFKCRSSSSNSCFINSIFCCLFWTLVCYCRVLPSPWCHCISMWSGICRLNLLEVAHSSCGISVLMEPHDNRHMTVPHPLLLDTPTSASCHFTCLACYLLRSNVETLPNDWYIQWHCVRTACFTVHTWKCCCSRALLCVFAQWIF